MSYLPLMYHLKCKLCGRINLQDVIIVYSISLKHKQLYDVKHFAETLEALCLSVVCPEEGPQLQGREGGHGLEYGQVQPIHQRKRGPPQGDRAGLGLQHTHCKYQL